MMNVCTVKAAFKSLLLSALVMALLLCGCAAGKESTEPTVVNNTEPTVGESTEPTVVKNTNSISIPGYEMLELKAGSTQQTLCLPNPAQNTCYFQISLYMEDGTLLWESELIEPGQTSKPIVLTKALEKGMYPKAVLRYACFTMDENKAQLNGAETKVTLWVK